MAALKRRFLERARTDRADLAAALRRMDRPLLLRLAHGLSGIAGIFGHADVGARAAALEQAVNDGASDPTLAELVGELVIALDNVAQP